MKILTLLYSSSQRSSSRASIHFSTFSMIDFLLEASSFALEICSSMLKRRSEWSISPEVNVSQFHVWCFKVNRPVQFLEGKRHTLLSFLDSPEFMRLIILFISSLEGISTCDFLHINSSSSCFFWNSSFILLAFSWSSLLTSASVL